MCVVQQAPTSSSKLKGEGFCQRAAVAKLAQYLFLQDRQQAAALQAAKQLQSLKRIRFLAGECHAFLDEHTFCLSARHMTTFLCCTVLFWNSLQQLISVDAINDIRSSSFSVVHQLS